MTATAVVERPSARELAQRAMFACKGDPQKAARHLETLIRKDPDLFAELVNDFVRDQCEYLVRSMVHQQRERVLSHASPNHVDELTMTDQHGARVIALAYANVQSIFNFPIPGGKMLGEATGNEVRAAALEYLARGKTNSERGQWLMWIAERVGNQQKVKNALSETEILKLREKVEHE